MLENAVVAIQNRYISIWCMIQAVGSNSYINDKLQYKVKAYIFDQMMSCADGNEVQKNVLTGLLTLYM